MDLVVSGINQENLWIRMTLLTFGMHGDRVNHIML